MKDFTLDGMIPGIQPIEFPDLASAKVGDRVFFNGVISYMCISDITRDITGTIVTLTNEPFDIKALITFDLSNLMVDCKWSKLDE